MPSLFQENSKLLEIYMDAKHTYVEKSLNFIIFHASSYLTRLNYSLIIHIQSIPLNTLELERFVLIKRTPII